MGPSPASTRRGRCGAGSSASSRARPSRRCSWRLWASRRRCSSSDVSRGHGSADAARGSVIGASGPSVGPKSQEGRGTPPGRFSLSYRMPGNPASGGSMFLVLRHCRCAARNSCRPLATMVMLSPAWHLTLACQQRGSSSDRPVLHLETRHTLELADVVGNEREIKAEGMGGDECVERSDGRALLL